MLSPIGASLAIDGVTVIATECGDVLVSISSLSTTVYVIVASWADVNVCPGLGLFSIPNVSLSMVTVAVLLVLPGSVRTTVFPVT